MEERLVLACDSGSDEMGAIAVRLLRLGIDTLYAPSLAEAELLAGDWHGHIYTVLIPSHLEAEDIRKLVARARDASSAVVPTILVTGEAPGPERRAALREAGVTQALWSPDDDAALRFAVNSALTLPAERAMRSEPRVPTNLLASFLTDGPRRNATVYSLSSRGAFFETSRPAEKGSSLRIEMLLPERTVSTRGVAIYVNAPADRRDPRWPTGMSVIFGSISPADQSALRRYVAERVINFTV